MGLVHRAMCFFTAPAFVVIHRAYHGGMAGLSWRPFFVQYWNALSKPTTGTYRLRWSRAWMAVSVCTKAPTGGPSAPTFSWHWHEVVHRSTDTSVTVDRRPQQRQDAAAQLPPCENGMSNLLHASSTKQTAVWLVTIARTCRPMRVIRRRPAMRRATEGKVSSLNLTAGNII